ncbi:MULTISPECIES: antibiotic biosynthesis monooxygenase [unclassified Streptomyces]|uniref:antibiotic biosynthesis monooxygenase n=1 Tax=unclassified Streptomyces TaxID=2593676 RepID=UPI00380D3A5E
MSPLTTAFPDFLRADAGTALVSPWIVPTAGVQRAAADAVLAEWEQQSRPEAMLSLSVFLSTDGSHLLNHAQWTSDDAHRAWARTRRPALVDRIDETVPGIRRPGLVRYRRYRSHLAGNAPGGVTGRRPELLVTPAFTTVGPAAQHRLADTVLDLLAQEPVPGLLAAHFHLSQDGTRVLNYAEWEDLSAWQEFVRHGASGLMAARIAELDGVRPAPAMPLGPQTSPGGPPSSPDTTMTTTPQAPDMPAVAHYRLYKSLINVPAPDANSTPGSST